MKLQMSFVDKASGTAAWMDYDAPGMASLTGSPAEVHRVLGDIVIPPGIDALRVVTAAGVWTFQVHPTWGIVPRLVNDAGEIRAVWPKNVDVGGNWSTFHVLPDGHIVELLYVEGDPTFAMGEGATAKIVEVQAGFIARYPTTVREWNWYAAAMGKPLKPTSVTTPSGKKVDATYHPVTEVSYWDAVGYAEWAGVGLPSEEQWEHAARGKDGRKYPWGNDPPTADRCHSSIQTQQETTDDVRRRPTGASPYGVEDMAGNVWEWTTTVHK